MWILDRWRSLTHAIEQMRWEERLIIGAVILAILVAIAVYVIRRIRGYMQAPTATISDHLSDFRRMHDAGQIDDKEYNRVLNTVSRHEAGQAPIPPKEPPAQSADSPSPTGEG